MRQHSKYEPVTATEGDRGGASGCQRVGRRVTRIGTGVRCEGVKCEGVRCAPRGGGVAAQAASPYGPLAPDERTQKGGRRGRRR